MNVLFILIPIALLLAAASVAAFRWAVRNEQFDDLESPAVRVLFDETARTSADDKGFGEKAE